MIKEITLYGGSIIIIILLLYLVYIIFLPQPVAVTTTAGPLYTQPSSVTTQVSNFSNTNKNKSRSNITEHQSNTDKTKTLIYFGNTSCPYSNLGSRVYKLIEDFEKEFPDVNVVYNWSGQEDSMFDFQKANIKYVPTVTDDEYNVIELKLPSDINRDSMTDDELKQLLLSTIYNKL